MKTVLITGGSEGIGYELARLFAADGASLILCARNMMRLQEARTSLQNTFHVPVTLIAADLSLPGAAAKLYEKVKNGRVDVLVCCAGTGYTGDLISQKPEDLEKMILVNDNAAAVLTSLFLKDMCAERKGLILNVASTGAFQPGPYIAAYYASKSFILSFTKAAAREAALYGVKVSCLCPGPVDTAFYRKEGLKTPRFAMSASKCAAYAYRHMGKKTVIIPGLLNRIVRFLPESWRTSYVMKQKKRILDRK